MSDVVVNQTKLAQDIRATQKKARLRARTSFNAKNFEKVLSDSTRC